MRKVKKVLVAIITMSLLVGSTMAVFAEEAGETDATVVPVDESQLGKFAVENEENIVLLDEQDCILKEFHSDGYVAEFTYADTYSEESLKQLVSIIDSDGKVQEISYDEEGNIDHIDVYADGEHIGTKDFTASTFYNVELLSTKDYYTFYVTHSDGTKVNMSNLISDDLFVRQDTSATQQDIQNLFNNTGSPLKNDITIFKKNFSGGVYDTKTTVTPAKVIYEASVKYSVSPKVILTTLQKESSLVSNIHANDSLSLSCFYFCMGAGSKTSAQTTGFDRQIDLGTSTLQEWYQEGVDNYDFPYNYWHNAFRGYRGYGTTGYTNDIWCDNAATYSLYKYTPYTCDYNDLTHTGNVLFVEIYNGKMLSDFPL
ncbi:MAG: hypothetical protein K2K07_09210 [Lachnospiraceae bacterium]|nr:hypothetical protein [Lachnospiraceae bacterium]